MNAKSKIALICCVAVTGIICASSFLSYAQDDDTSVSETTAENPDYEEMLAPYENMFDEFNKSHGTTYGFATEEQMERIGKSREEYQKEMVEKYAGMTPEEFEQYLDEMYARDQQFLSEMESYSEDQRFSIEKQAYSEEQGLSPQNLPYYQKDESEVKKQNVSIPIDDNSYGIHYLKD